MQELDNERASQKETIADLEKQMQELDNERASQKETIADLEKQMQVSSKNFKKMRSFLFRSRKKHFSRGFHNVLKYNWRIIQKN
ncbi:hypothetical protein V5799_023002 [Amblyomma americanum]|uniref:Uncharacterized protein n=1 Tax=Amblyomma americanum TaxID=6943 RepID=A0AAQ4FKJ2_AMBAM